MALTGTATIAAVNDVASATASGVAGAVVSNINVRGNDIPTNGTITINSTSFTNGGATVSLVAVSGNNIAWTLTANGANAAANRTLRRGTYTVTYTLTSGTASATATATLTLT